MRKTKEIAIAREGRDKGKTFILEEMPADQAERWLMRMLEAVSKSGADVSVAVRLGGYAGLYSLGIRALLGAPYALTEPLYAELMDCVKLKEPAVTRKPTADDIEEVQTRLLLKDEVFKLHTGFSVADYLSRVWEQSQSAIEQRTSMDTPTSGPSAAPSSPPASPA